jgi:hypothetical protein
VSSTIVGTDSYLASVLEAPDEGWERTDGPRPRTSRHRSDASL